MKKTISLLLAFALSLALTVPALAYDEAAETQQACSTAMGMTRTATLFLA